MLIMTQETLNTGLAFYAAQEYYGFQTGPVTVLVTGQLSERGPHRLYAAYAFMFTGNGLVNPTAEQLALFKLPV